MCVVSHLTPHLKASMPPLPQFLPRLRELIAREPTQAAAASRMGITPSHLSQILKGTYKPSRKLIAQIADGFGVDRDEWEVLAGFRESVAGPDTSPVPATDIAWQALEAARRAEEEARRTREEVTRRLDQVLGKGKSPIDEYWELYRALYEELAPQGYDVAPPDAGRLTGDTGLTVEKVRREIQRLRDETLIRGKLKD